MAKLSNPPGPGATSILRWLQPGVAVEPAPLYWVCGSEDYLRELALRKLRQALVEPGFAEFNHQVLRLTAQTKLGTILDALAELPMMTDSRVLELQNIHELSTKAAESLAVHLGAQATPGLIVVVVSEAARGKSALWDYLTQHAQLLSCELDPKQRGDFVHFCCQQHGLKLTGGQQQTLAERCAGSLRLISGALERIKLFAGESDKIGDQDLDSLVHDSAETQAWKLTAAIGARDLPKAYGLLSRILQREAPQSLISYINSYLLGLVQVAELRPRLQNAAAIARELPRKNEFQVRKTLEELSSWSETELASGFERLARADFRIKTGTDPLLMMQLLILQLCSRQGGPA